jgi:copper/silver efflux system protein
MIERIIELSIRNRALVLVLAAALTAAGIYATVRTPIDAIPDLSENQAIVFTDWMGRSPREIEDQVTYPLSLKLQGLAGVRTVRSSSEFNFSMITIIFEDGIDFYFARQRVTEKLTQAGNFLPPGVMPYLAPDATALGQIFWYTVEPSRSNPIDPQQLWALNKFYIAPQLNSAAGVADVATVGGAPLEYQVDVRPEMLRAYGVTLGKVYAAVGKSNLPSGGGVVQKNNAEYIVRGVGWIHDKQDIENTVIREINGVPIYVKSIATVQLGTQFRRSVFEKDGNEVVGGVVLMRYQENPLAVTENVKRKIEDLQSGLPDGVHIVPAYDRTRLIHGAIDTLTDVMRHEMLIASLAVLLILLHVRSVFVICVTLPLSVLFSFLLMAVLRVLGIVDIQANIMSLAGITISIGILVDQAIVMTENATHHLKAHFGDRKVTGDTRELVIAPCRTVGRPIFFSVMIMLLSFVPVFLLSGREGKLFHPLAFTKSFAMIGVALISITVVPALIPTFLRGRLRSEEENPIVRSFINIYRPLLTWALPRRNLVMWMFAALLILAAGLFPLQAIVGQGSSELAWRTAFLSVFAIVTGLTVVFTRGVHWQVLSLGSLVVIGLWAYHFPKIGVAFMPPLDEGTTLDMPITVPRASVTEAADDLKARDALLRGFPEVESVIGKAGRADTPTDPAPLDMVETFVNFRPKELWPKRVLRYEDARRQTADMLAVLESRGFVSKPSGSDARDSLINEATQRAIETFDREMRELALRRYQQFEQRLSIRITHFAIEDFLRMERDAGWLKWPPAGTPGERTAEERRIAELTDRFTDEHGRWLALNPTREEVGRLVERVAHVLNEQGALDDLVGAMELNERGVARFWSLAVEAFGGEHKSLTAKLLERIDRERLNLWRDAVTKVNWELFDRGVEIYCRQALAELAQAATHQSLLPKTDAGARLAALAERASTLADNGPHPRGGGEAGLLPRSEKPDGEFSSLLKEIEKPFQARVLFWPRHAGPKGDLVDDEMGRVLQVPGWSNIFTQPIINRIEMLSTGVRTDIGVKVFGPDLETIDGVSKAIEAALKPLAGARDVVAAPIMGKGYLQIDINRENAARYGITVEDIQNEIEMAIGGKAVTFTVEKRDRFPVRIRYVRARRDDEDAVRRLLIGPGGMGRPAATTGGGIAEPAAMTTATSGGAAGTRAEPPTGGEPHVAGPSHAKRGTRLIPLSAVADIHIVEGPAMIKSENGRLLNYVTLNVRGRDIVGFVDEAQRMVAENIPLPEGVHIEWSGEFEHQVRAARTLRFVFPIVIVLIFVILYLTYHDLADAGLMMLAVPEALAGGAFFMYLFPKVLAGWQAPPLDFSVAVWVGFIACFGMATETGIIMLVYLREAITKRGGLENIKSLAELREAVIEGAVHRLRPKLLTEGVAIIAIFPMVFSRGVGGEILAPMALPVLGGLLISDEVVDLFLPVRFYWIRRRRWLKLQEQKGALQET